MIKKIILIVAIIGSGLIFFTNKTNAMYYDGNLTFVFTSKVSGPSSPITLEGLDYEVYHGLEISYNGQPISFINIFDFLRDYGGDTTAMIVLPTSGGGSIQFHFGEGLTFFENAAFIFLGYYNNLYTWSIFDFNGNELINRSSNNQYYFDSPTVYVPLSSTVSYLISDSFSKGYADGKKDANESNYTLGYDYGYDEGYYKGYNKGAGESLESSGFGAVLFSGFGAIGAILQVELLPNITIGAIVAIPIVFGVVMFIIGRRKE